MAKSRTQVMDSSELCFYCKNHHFFGCKSSSKSQENQVENIYIFILCSKCIIWCWRVWRVSATVSSNLQTRKTVKIAWWFRAFHYNRDPYTNGHPQPFIKISTFRKIAKKVRKIDEKWKCLLYPIFFLCWKTRIKHPFPPVLELESDFWQPIFHR